MSVSRFSVKVPLPSHGATSARAHGVYRVHGIGCVLGAASLFGGRGRLGRRRLDECRDGRRWRLGRDRSEGPVWSGRKRRDDSHARTRIPVLLFGGKFLKLGTGQFIAVSPNRYVNDIWSSVLTAWGVPTNVYGDPQYSQGILPNLFGR